MAHLTEHNFFFRQITCIVEEALSSETQLITIINDRAKILVKTSVLDFEKAFEIFPHKLRKCKPYCFDITLHSLSVLTMSHR